MSSRPEVTRRRGLTVAERIELFSVPEPNSGCILWTGALIPAGYGMIGVDGKKLMAHRVAYELSRGPIPKGLVLDHLCRVRSCVNAFHLEPVTHAENLRRGIPNASAANAAKTECIRGHALSGENLYESPDGHRHCRACTAEARARYYRKNRETVIAKASAANRKRRALAAGGVR